VTEAHLTVDRARQDEVRIAIDGEIDLANATVVERQILDAISNQDTEVALDLHGLTYVDSAGLRVLFTLGRRLETLQIALEIVVPTESSIRKMIELSGIATAIQVRSAGS
jgi:anti-sigma B factor antagonist